MHLGTNWIHSKKARIAAILGLTAAAVVLTSSPSYAINLPISLSSSQGPSAGTPTIIATTLPGTGSADGKILTSSIGVEFVAPGACPNYYTTEAPTSTTAPIVAIAPAGIKLISANQVAITLDTDVKLMGTATTTQWKVCIFADDVATVGTTNGSPLIANGTYTVAGAVTPTSVAPTTGPSQGGTLLTINGTGFPVWTTGTPPVTVTLGGVAVQNLTSVSNTKMTATTPPHAPLENAPLVINSAAGASTLASAFDYSNGISVSPNTAQADAVVTLYVQGVGFSDIAFTGTTGATTPDAAGGHVYLVQGEYDSLDDSGDKTVEQAAECGDVVRIDDTRLICTIDLDGLTEGTYTVTVVNDGQVDAVTDNANYQQSILSSGATFTIAPYRR